MTMKYKDPALSVRWDSRKYRTPTVILTLPELPEFHPLEVDMLLHESFSLTPSITYSTNFPYLALSTIRKKPIVNGSELERVTLRSTGQVFNLERQVPIPLLAQVNDIFELNGDQRLIPITVRAFVEDRYKYLCVLCLVAEIRSLLYTLPRNLHLFIAQAAKEGNNSLHLTPSYSADSLMVPTEYSLPNYSHVEAI